jgi:hypothetical protein
MHVQPVGFTAKGMFEIKNLIDQVEKLVVGNAPNKELDVSIPPPLGYRDPTFYRRRRVYSCPPHINATIIFWVMMCWILWGDRGLGSPRNAIGINSLRI